jgi:hypothetical protein
VNTVITEVRMKGIAAVAFIGAATSAAAAPISVPYWLSLRPRAPVWATALCPCDHPEFRVAPGPALRSPGVGEQFAAVREIPCSTASQVSEIAAFVRVITWHKECSSATST